MNKAIIVTGAGGGIGSELIHQFLTIEDLIVIGIYRSSTAVTKIDHARFISRQCNVQDFGSVQQTFQELARKYLLDGLVNCAGIAYSGEFLAISHEHNQNMLETNVSGLTNCIEAVLPFMRENSCGTIINLSSVADRYPRPEIAIYAASKAYVKSLSDSLRVDNATHNIRVMNIAPALIQTPMVAQLWGNVDTIKVSDFAQIIKSFYQLPQQICIRDIVIAPTSYAK